MTVGNLVEGVIVLACIWVIIDMLLDLGNDDRKW